MTWQKFNAKTAIPKLPPNTIQLDKRNRTHTFTLDNWQEIANATHFLYLFDADAKRIALQPLNEFQDEEEAITIAYKITRNGHRRVSVTCTKLFQSLPFQLVDEQEKNGKWMLNFEWADGLIVINQQIVTQARDELGDATGKQSLLRKTG